MDTLTLEQIATDEEGFFLNPEQWNQELAKAVAQQEGIDLETDHWRGINFIRNYFEERQIVPENRTLLKFLKENLSPEPATRRYIPQLFPYGYGQQACQIAGMRKPRKLMLDV